MPMINKSAYQILSLSLKDNQVNFNCVKTHQICGCGCCYCCCFCSNVWSKNIQVKKFWIQKRPKTILGPKILGHSKMLPKKFGTRNIWVKRNFVKKNCAQRHIQPLYVNLVGIKTFSLVRFKIRFGSIFSSILDSIFGFNIWLNIGLNIAFNIRLNIELNIGFDIGQNIGLNIWLNIGFNIGFNIWVQFWVQ